MPSSPMPGGATSPHRMLDVQRSRFTYRQLAQLTSYSTSNPLRVVAHIDLDAFYAQCEMVRLGVPKDTPLAVQQWCVSPSSPSNTILCIPKPPPLLPSFRPLPDATCCFLCLLQCN